MVAELGKERGRWDVSRFSFQMSAASGDHGSMTRAITLLGREVAPLVRHATLAAPRQDAAPV